MLDDAGAEVKETAGLVLSGTECEKWFLEDYSDG